MKRFLMLSVLAALIATPAALACDGHGAAMAASMGHDCPSMMKGVEKTVTNLDNGARIELTASDPAMVEKLQKHMTAEKKEGCCKDCPMSNAAWDRKVENTAKGVVVTLTANSKEDVAKLQTAVAAMANGGCSHGEGAGCPKGANKAVKA